MKTEKLIQNLHWLGHDSFRLDGPPVIYFDPWKLKDKKLPTADLILVSHQHSDHCSPDDVKHVSGPDTIVVASALAADKLPGAQAVAPGETLSAAGVEIAAVPAYNVNKFRSPGVPFHPQEDQHVGYIVTLDNTRLYFAGDTDAIPEMEDFNCDIALLPVSGTYVMTVEEAVEAANMLKPQIAVPMHYGSGIGSGNDGQRFADLYEGKVVLLEGE